MTKILFMDCETNGLPLNYNASYTEVYNWPRVLSLAWILTDDAGIVIDQRHDLVLPDGWEIPKERFWLDHGHTQENNVAHGIPITTVLDHFMEAKLKADILCCHNLSFDHRVVWSEFIRAGREPRTGMHKICTMQASTDLCKLPSPKGWGYKWPKLEELYRFLFGKPMDNAHDAMADITATKECFFELVARQVISIPQLEKTAV